MLEFSAKELRSLIHALATESRVFAERLSALDEDADENEHSEVANDLQEIESLREKIERKYKQHYG